MSIKLCVLLCLAALLLWSQPVRAAESYDNCTGIIEGLAFHIKTPGIWCLKKNVTTQIYAGAAISVEADDVTVDCNGFSITDFPINGVGADGIAAINRHNVTVRNCIVRGFLTGLYFSDMRGGGHTIEDNVFDDNNGWGILLEGNRSVVRRNRVLNTGGAENFGATGIKVTGDTDIVGSPGTELEFAL